MLSGGSNLVVGLALSLQGLGQMITPMVGANLISHRSRVLPIGFVLGSLMRLCVLLMGLAGFFLDDQATLIAVVILLGVREPEPPTLRAQTSLGQQLREVPALLRAEKPFRRYIVARAIATMGRMAMPFYILYAGQTIGLSGEILGIVTFAFTMSGTFSNLLWGYLADARGFRLVMLITTVLWILSMLLLLVSTDFIVTVIVFVGIGAATQGFENAARNIVLEFGDRENLPVRIALANSVSQVTGSIGPLLGGVLSTALGYESVFIVSIIFLGMGAWLIFFRIPEPRRQSGR